MKKKNIYLLVLFSCVAIGFCWAMDEAKGPEVAAMAEPERGDEGWVFRRGGISDDGKQLTAEFVVHNVLEEFWRPRSNHLVLTSYFSGGASHETRILKED